MADVDIKIGADTTELDKGSQSVKSKLDDLSSSVNSLQKSFASFGADVQKSFGEVESGITALGSKIKDLFEAIQKGDSLLDSGVLKLLLGAGVGAALGGVFSAVHDLNADMAKIPDSARLLGLTVERFQELQAGIDKTGKTDDFTKGLENAAKKLNELNHNAGELGKFLDANNVKWKDASGHIIDMNKYIEVAGRLVYNAGTMFDRLKAGQILGFGKEWTDKFGEGLNSMNKAIEEAHENGDIFTRDQIENAKKFDKAWNDSSGDWSKMWKQTVVAITPFVMDLLSWLGKASDYLKDTFGDAVKEWSSTFIAALGTIKSYLDALVSTLDKAARYVSGVASELAKAFKSAITEGYGGNVETTKVPAAPMAGTMDANISSMQQFMLVTNNTEKTWEKMIGDAKSLNQEILQMASDSMPGAGTATKFPNKGDDRAQLTKLNEQLDDLREYYAKMKVMEDSAVARSVETEGQKVAHLLTALDQWAAGAQVIYDKEVAIVGNDANKILEIKRKAAKLQETILMDQMKLEAEQLKKSQQEWESVVGSISGAFNSQLRGLLAGTTTWAHAMRSIAADLVLKMIEEFEKLALVKPLSSMLASALSAPTELFQGLLNAIKSMFGPLMAGFTSFFAPSLGPAAPAAGAAAATATTAVATAAVGAFEFGTDFVPRTGMALVHEGEAIIPRTQNPAAGGGGGFGGGVSPVFNIQALDSTGVQAFFTRYGPQVAKMLTAHINQNPSLQT